MLCWHFWLSLVLSGLLHGLPVLVGQDVELIKKLMELISPGTVLRDNDLRNERLKFVWAH